MTERINYKKNIQISRIFRLKNPNLTIIYICPFPLCNEIVKYYLRILDFHNIPNYRMKI